MTDIHNDGKALEEFKNKVLELERESLSNLSQYDDSQMISKIIRIYEEVKEKYEN